MVGNTFDFFDTYDYDHLNRLTDLFQFAAPFVSPTNTVAQKSAEFEYNQLGQFTRIERFGGNYDENPNVISTYSYDHANRLTGLVDALPDESSTVVASYGWAYDRANRIASFANAVHTSESLNYTYDAAGQLTGYAEAGTTSYYGGSYSYDSNGNRTSTSTTAAFSGTVTHDYTTGVFNETTSDGQYQYEYDGLGNMTQKVKLDENDDATGETTVYGWDWRNRLTTATDYASYSAYSSSGASLWHVTYVYDAFNQMVGRKEYDGTTLAKSEHFIYDNGQIVLKLADDGTVKQRYLWAPVVDMLLAQEDGSTNDILWALGDNLNTIRDWVDDSGAVVAHRSYDPFGVAQAAFASGTVDSSFAWTAKFRDERTGLQYNQHGDSAGRWYDPHLGKWLSRDPAGIDAQTANLYTYTANAPTNYTDAQGLAGDPSVTLDKTFQLNLVGRKVADADKANVVQDAVERRMRELAGKLYSKGTFLMTQSSVDGAQLAGTSGVAAWYYIPHCGAWELPTKIRCDFSKVRVILFSYAVAFNETQPRQIIIGRDVHSPEPLRTIVHELWHTDGPAYDANGGAWTKLKARAAAAGITLNPAPGFNAGLKEIRSKILKDALAIQYSSPTGQIARSA